jgi:putative DNA primase/helicase
MPDNFDFQEDKDKIDTNLNFDFILNRIPSRVRNRIFSPPRAENEKEKNLYYVIRQLLKLEDVDDEQIENLLSLYPIGKNQNLKLAIEKVKNGNPSEETLSLEFTSKFKEKINFCPLWGKWLVWEGSYWKEDNRNLYRKCIRDVLNEVEMPDFRRRAATVKGIEHLIESEPDLTSEPKDWDQNLWLLSTPNGTIDLKKGVRRISYQEDKITKITSVAPKKKPITKWLRFLLEATKGDKQYVRYLQRVAGYCLTGNINEHSLFFLYGPGGNGKGVFLNTITQILGDYAVAAPLGMFMENKFDGHPTELALLRGARLVTAQEVQEGKAWNEVKIKSLTGGDPISARFVNQDFFTFIPNFKLLISGNHEPQLRNVDDATTRRFNKLPFTNRPKLPNKNLIDELRFEHEGILQWMINGCIAWQEIGLNVPQIVMDSTEEYFSSQNTFQEFLDDKCEILINDRNFNENSNDLFRSWCNFAMTNHIRQGNMANFRENLEKFGIKYTKNLPNKHGVRGFIGIKLKSVPKPRTKQELEIHLALQNAQK